MEVYQEVPPVSESTVADYTHEVGLGWRDTDTGDLDCRETGVDQPSPSRAPKDDEDYADADFKHSGDHDTAEMPLGRDGDGKHPDGGLSESQSSSDDDFASGAAIAMAAVAAAASATTSSPSAAAEAARAMAPNLVPETISTRKDNIAVVRLPAVKAQMLKRIGAVHKANHSHIEHGSYSQKHRDVVEQRLAQGENDAFLQYLLLFQYFRTCEENNESCGGSSAVGDFPDLAGVDGQSIGQNSVLTSAEKVRSMLHMAEEAYDAMEALLPPMPIESSVKIDGGDAEYYGMDTPLVVPDLLPPCTSVPGDATLQFFLACRGELEVEKFDDSSTVDDNAADSRTAIADSTNEIHNADPSGVNKSATSVFTSMFSSMTRATKHQPVRPTNTTLAGVFRIRTRPNELVSPENEVDTPSRPVVDDELAAGEYSVSIDREMLGLTVENVLERTVVRTVLPGGAAKKAGAKVGSLIVKVGNVETKNLTHFETIDELRQSQRPLKLILRQIPGDSLRSAREEMGRLIRGGGFGTALPAEHNETSEGDKRSSAANYKRPHHGKPGNIEALAQVLHQRWSNDGMMYPSKKEEALVHAGEKLVWILTLLVIGLEREASKAPSAKSRETAPDGSPGRRSHTSHVVEDYVDASRSVSKVLLDFVTSRLLAGEQKGDSDKNSFESMRDNTGNRLRRGPQVPPSGRHGARVRAQDAMTAKRSRDANNHLLRIGDVLHRTRSFLADPASPPAALVRGEVICFLCDILDIDMDMELSEEEGGSPTAGITAPLNDLGSAGSLLKLIILNCSMMRSPGCTSFRDATKELDFEAEQRRRFGSLKKHVNGLDLHRFHAGNRFLSVVHRLAASRSISARITACSLGPVLWGHLDFPHQLQVRDVTSWYLSSNSFPHISFLASRRHYQGTT